MPSNRGIPTNENDLMQMQQEAVRRVREMQERARRAVERSNQGAGYSPPVSRPVPHHPAVEEDLPPVEVIQPHPEPPPRKILRKRRHNKILPFDFPIGSLSKTLDFEDMLLIGLIILLMNEGADEMIVLALGYILVSDMDFIKKRF